MSHGSSSSEKCEPNLIPLLDLVLQLVMFFMVCANFVMEQVNETIKLPEAIAARALDKKVEYALFLNVNQDGVVLLPPNERVNNQATLDNPDQVKSFMRRRYDEDMRAQGGDKTKDPRTAIIIRADARAKFDKVYGIMKACQQAGFKTAQLRTIIGNSN